MYPSRFGYLKTDGALHLSAVPSPVFFTHIHVYVTHTHISKHSCLCYGFQIPRLTTAGRFPSQVPSGGKPCAPLPAPRAGVRPAARARRERPQFFPAGKRFLGHRAGCPPSRRTGKLQACPFPLPPRPQQWCRQKRSSLPFRCAFPRSLSSREQWVPSVPKQGSRGRLSLGRLNSGGHRGGVYTFLTQPGPPPASAPRCRPSPAPGTGTGGVCAPRGERGSFPTAGRRRGAEERGSAGLALPHGPGPDGRSRLSPTEAPCCLAAGQLKCSWPGVCPHLRPLPEAPGGAHALSTGSSGSREPPGAGETRPGRAYRRWQVRGLGHWVPFSEAPGDLSPRSQMPPSSPCSPEHLLGKTGHSFYLKSKVKHKAMDDPRKRRGWRCLRHGFSLADHRTTRVSSGRCREHCPFPRPRPGRCRPEAMLPRCVRSSLGRCPALPPPAFRGWRKRPKARAAWAATPRPQRDGQGRLGQPCGSPETLRSSAPGSSRSSDPALGSGVTPPNLCLRVYSLEASEWAGCFSLSRKGAGQPRDTEALRGAACAVRTVRGCGAPAGPCPRGSWEGSNPPRQGTGERVCS